MQAAAAATTTTPSPSSAAATTTGTAAAKTNAVTQIKTTATKKLLTNSSSTVTSKATRVLQKQQHAVSTHTTKTITGPGAAAAATATTDPNGEIEELTKKINEHADAIYQTWRMRGLAPTELPEIYATTNAAGASQDFFSGGGSGNANAAGAKANAVTAAAAVVAAAAGVDSAEGLQQLVNTFVIKDKEQRGVKVASGNAIKTAATTTTTKKATSGVEIGSEKVTQQQTLKKPAVQKTRAKSPTTTSKTTAALDAATAATTTTSTKNNACVVGNKKLDAASTPKKSTTTTTTAIKTAQSPKATTTSTLTSVATPTATPPPTIDVNLNFDLNLLTKQQTENLLKISELLQKEQAKEKEKERATAATKAKTTTTATATEVTTSTVKRKEPSALTTTTTTTPTTKKITKENGKTADARKMATAVQELMPTTKNTTTTTKVSTLKSAKTTTTSDNKTSANKLAKNNGNNVDTVDVGAATPTLTLTSTSTPSYTFQSTSLLINARDRVADNLNADISNIKTTDKNSATSMNKRGATASASTATLNKINAEESQLQSAKLIKAAAASTKDNHTKAELGGGGGTIEAASKINRATANTSATNNNNTITSDIAIIAKEKPSLNRAAIGAKSSTTSGIANIAGKSTQNAQNLVNSSTPSSSVVGNTIAIRTHSVANAKHNQRGEETAAAAAATEEERGGNSGNGNGSVVVGSVGMEIARTTMPTLNKVKPTSGRAALTNGQDKNLGRPILTRGSVAERVLMFEKCPDVRSVFLDIKRPSNDVLPKSLQKVKLHATPPSSGGQQQDHNSLQREIRSTKSVYIPRFYFPHGKPQPTIAMERVLRGILSAFDSFPNNQVTKDELPRILKLCGLPFYWRMPVMVYCQQGNSGLVERQRFVEFWKQMNVYCHEPASRFVYILSRGQRFHSYIVPEDLVPMVQDVVDTHPGLAFLKEATEFHSRYVHTVIARIFYSVNRSWSGKITISELKRSDLLEMISLLEEEDDINQIMAFFSYEHFYVIYCKFWELDKDHDLLINQDDLARHSDHALSTRIVERIFSGCVTRNDNKKSAEDESKMSYTDFVWFILSEEDKRTPTAIEYWFRCMDVDGDGALSMYELEYFYEEQQQRMEAIGIECLPFEDCLCQMLDMIKPQNREFITLGDLKRCKMTHVFFDTFFNLEKYLDHEQRDPFASQRDEYNSDWDRFAAQEYELLITEEND